MKPDAIEALLFSRQLPDLPLQEAEWILPHYDGLSIANLPATIAALLGTQDSGQGESGDTSLSGALPTLAQELWADWLPGLRRIVLLVFDALGYRLLQSKWAAGEGRVFAELAEKGQLAPLTSVFPSTTAAALVSLRTGRPPAEHGWLAYTMYLRELGVAGNAIQLCPIWMFQPDLLLDWGLDIDTLVTVPTLAEHLASRDIPSKAVLNAHYRDSGFSKMLYRGMTEVRGHLHASDFWVQLRHLLAETRGQNAMISAYWSGLDTLGHAYGQDSPHWETEFRTVSHLLEHEFLSALPAEDRGGTLLLLTADHGQITIPPERILTVSDHPELGQHLMVPVVGESRAAFVYPRPGRASAIRTYLQQVFPDCFVALDSVRALEAGLMGKPITDETYARAGEILVLPKRDFALQHRYPRVPLIGRHGGLTQDEMLVPFIGIRLEDLA
jgi:hypothetical protein